MGRTSQTYREYDDEDRSKKNSRGSKHSRNIPGKGMRVINSWYDEDEDDEFDDDIELEDSIEIVHTKAR